MYLRTKIEGIMRDLFRDRPNGYIESIKRGQAVMSYLNGQMVYGEGLIQERTESWR